MMGSSVFDSSPVWDWFIAMLDTTSYCEFRSVHGVLWRGAEMIGRARTDDRATRLQADWLSCRTGVPVPATVVVRKQRGRKTTRNDPRAARRRVRFQNGRTRNPSTPPCAGAIGRRPGPSTGSGPGSDRPPDRRWGLGPLGPAGGCHRRKHHPKRRQAAGGSLCQEPHEELLSMHRLINCGPVTRWTRRRRRSAVSCGVPFPSQQGSSDRW